MNMQAYIDEIKLELTGGVLDLEIDDLALSRIVNSAMRELQRYICSTKLITVPFEKCISLKDLDINAVARVYRASALESSGNNSTDPVEVGLWQLTSNAGNMYNYNDYMLNYLTYSTLQQTRNTLSTDLAWYYEDSEKRLYINTALGSTEKVTIEYVPRYNSVEEITSDFWIDVLMRLSKALSKVAVGRIRSKFTQSNALWTLDGATMLQEGQNELSELRTYMQKNTQLLYAVD